jgi:cell division protease FtsH
MGNSRDYSETTARMIDEEVSRIVRDAQRLADEILRKEIDLLHHLAKELLKYETIDTKDLKIILEGKKLTRPLNGKKTYKSNKRANYSTKRGSSKDQRLVKKKDPEVKKVVKQK